MKHISFLMLIMVSFLLTSCSLGAPEPTQTPTPTLALPTATEPLPSSTPTPTFTAEPTDIPTPVLTATPSFPMVTPIDEPVNCRFGPSVDYAQVGALKVGEYTQVFGKTSAGDWWQVQNPTETSQKCWVAASVTTGSGNFSEIGVVIAPTAFVTNLTLKVDMETISLSLCTDPFEPINLKGTIETNGPLTAKWHFETEQGGVMPEQTLEFKTFGSQDVSAEYMPLLVKPGTYWVRLIVTSPNSTKVETTYKIDCP